MMTDLPEGQTHYENDGCGEPAHNKPMTYDKQTYERLKNFPNGNDDEAELCDLIAEIVKEKQQAAAVEYHRAKAESSEAQSLESYWRAMILDRAVDFVNDWKNSL